MFYCIFGVLGEALVLEMLLNKLPLAKIINPNFLTRIPSWKFFRLLLKKKEKNGKGL